MIQYFLFPLFAFFVITVWVSVHTQNQDDPWTFFLAPILIFLILIGGASLWRYRRTPRLFNISPAWLVGYTLLLAWLIFNFSSFFRLIPMTHQPLLSLSLWWSANGAFLCHLVLLTLLLMLGTLTFRLTGEYLSNFLTASDTQIPHPSNFSFLSTITVGMFAWVLLALGLGSLGLLNTSTVLIGVVVIFWFGKSQLSQFWVWFISPLNCTSFMKSPWLEVMLFVLFLVAASLVDGIRPLPTGYDDMTYYMNRVQLMSEREELVPGGRAFPFELLATVFQQSLPIFGLLSGMSFGLLCFLLGGYTVYAFGKDIMDSKTGLVATALWMSLPMTTALTFMEVKPDTLLFFVSSLGVWSWIQWLRLRHPLHFYQTAFLFGFAVSIKYTALFLGGAFVVSLLFEFWRTKTWKSLSLRMVIISSGWCLLPLLPWFIYHLNTVPLHQKIKLDSLTHSTPSAPILTAPTWEHLGIDPKTTCQWKGPTEDYSRYHLRHQGLSRLVFAPWDITMNTRVGFFASEIGFLFLVFLPLWLSKKTRSDTAAPALLLVLLACGYFSLWFYFGEFVPWYAFPGSLFLVLLTAPLLTHSSSPISWRTVLWIIFFLGLLSHLAIRLKFTLTPPGLQYAARFSNQEGAIRSTFPSFVPVLKIIQEDPAAHILIMGSGIRYFIKENDRRVVDDFSLDVFSCINHENDPALTLRRLQKLRIRYIYISRERIDQETQSEQVTVRDKIGQFLHFAQENLVLVTQTDIGHFYQVPSQASE